MHRLPFTRSHPPRASLLLVAVCAFGAATARAQPVGDLNDAIVARVNGEPLLLSQLKEMALDLDVPVAALRLEGLRGEGYRRAISGLVDEELLVQEARRQGIAADSASVALRIEEMIRGLMEAHGSEANVNERLKASHLSLDALRRMLERKESRAEMAAAVVARRVKVTPSDILAYEKERSARGASGEEIRLAQILVACAADEQGSATGKERRDRAFDAARAAGTDAASFAAAAAEFTDDPSGRARGGLLGWVDSSSLRPELAARASRMRPGEISEPVTTDAGFHVLMLLDRRTPRDAVFGRKFEEERTKLLESLREKASLEIYPLGGSEEAPSSG